ncbi:MAG: pyrroline-5-carboxylate reductase [Planctomycetes bacterium]|nr:pyrroline-5-carboxylate reductase [Planctomycetota bacterium]
MATAIRDGLLKSFPPNSLVVYDPALHKSWGELGCGIYESPEALFAESDWVVWSVKPQVFKAEKDTWKSLPFSGKGMISIMAGICSEAIEELFPGIPVIRTMPNTPMMVGQGMVALSRGKNAEEHHLHFVENLFAPVAKTICVQENQMDGVTAISGSGPAYLFYLAEEVHKQAKSLGLSEEQASLLWSQTIQGAAIMLEGSGLSPTELRAQVTSPGGTTQAALETFEQGQMAEAFGQGLLAAKKRSEELS